MKRLSNEDGIGAAARNVGRYFLFGALPMAAGMAALYWIGAASGWIDFQVKRNVAARSMNSVGITIAPSETVKVFVYPGDCLKPDNGSFMSGQRITFYVHNGCPGWASGASFYYRVKAHDGTVISSHEWAFDGDRDIGPNEKREQRFSVEEDSRIESVEIRLMAKTK